MEKSEDGERVELDTDRLRLVRKVVSGRRITDAIRSLVNARDLQLEYSRILHKTLFVPVLMYGNKTMLWKEKQDLVLRLYRWAS